MLDYKTQSDQVLRNKLHEPGEDVQLACYAYAHEAADAAFVSIENGKVKAGRAQARCRRNWRSSMPSVWCR